MFNPVTPAVTEVKSTFAGKRWIVATVIVAGGLIAAACGSSTPPAKASSGSGHHSTTTTSTTASSTTTTAAGATTTTAKSTTATTAKSTTATTAKTTVTTAAPAGANALGGANDFNTPAAKLTGAGSTFDQPLFARQFYDYSKSNSKVSTTYASVGSGAGETDIIGGTVNFGASDVPEPSATTGTGGALLQIPVVLGGIAMAYNEPCLGAHAQLTGSQIAKIYSGAITDWNTINPTACPSGSTIEPVYRADSSGTSNAFTHYLTSVDAGDWPASLDGKQPAFPKGEGGNGNAGVAGDVQNGQGTVGYVELAYALQSSLAYASVQNSSGAFVLPSLASVSADAAAFPNVTADNYLIVNGSGAGAYPISTYSWIILYQKQSNTSNGIALGKMIHWMVTAGQSDASAIGYAPLPSNIVSLAETTINQMQNSSGQALF